MNSCRLKLILLSALLGLLLCACTDDNAADLAAHDHNTHEHSDIDLLIINPDAKKPEIKLSVEEDSMTGWNIHIDTSHFSFSPAKVNQPPSSVAEGHAHIYVDGFKIARVYSPWYHLKALTPGPHLIRIALNANDHSNLSYNGIALEATINIIQH